MVDYASCDAHRCNPDKGICAAVLACSHKVIKQIDGAFEPPMIFYDLCLGCWECIEACPLRAVRIMHVT